MNRFILPFATLALTPLCGHAQGQPPQTVETPLVAVPATADVLRAFQLNAATTQTLTVPATVAKPFKVDVILSGRRYTLDLRPYDIRSVNYKLLVDDGKKITEVPAGPSTTYRGAVVGLANTAIAASLIGGQLWAEIHTTGGLFAVQPISKELPKYPRASHVVYQKRHVKNLGTRCGVRSVPVAAPRTLQANNGGAALEAEIAVDADYAFYVRNGKNRVSTQSAVSTVLNAVNVIYKRDVDIQYKLTTTIIRETKVYNSTTITGLLSEMRTRWNNSHSGIPRDLAHMFTGLGPYSGIIGFAYVGVVCDTANAYGVSMAYNSTTTINDNLVAHELGHNWNAVHCAAICSACNPAGCHIMCPFITNCAKGGNVFGTASKNSIIAFRNTRTCLGGASPTYTYYGAGCKSTSVACDTTCDSQNKNGGTLSPPTLGKEYCYAVNPSSTVRTVCGVRLYTRQPTGGPATMICAVYHEATATKPRLSPVTVGATLTLGSTAKFYEVTFDNPVTVPALKRIWISQFSTPTMQPALLTQAPNLTPSSLTFERATWQSGSWNGTGTTYPSMEVRCIKNSIVPLLTNTSLPRIGKSFGLQISSAIPNTAVVFIWGGSDTMWGTTPLPWDLTPLGATNCSLLASWAFGEGSVTDGMGVATSPPFQLPLDWALVGSKFYNQGWVFDPGANPAGYLMTRGGVSKIGL